MLHIIRHEHNPHSVEDVSNATKKRCFVALQRFFLLAASSLASHSAWFGSASLVAVSSYPKLSLMVPALTTLLLLLATRVSVCSNSVQQVRIMPSYDEEEKLDMMNDTVEEECILPPGSIQNLSINEAEEDLETRKSIAIVEEQLLSFYNHQLEQHSHYEQQQDAASKAARQQAIQQQQQQQLLDLPIHKPHAYPCKGTHATLPSPPSIWPQAPVMLRPTPLSHTKIRGIRPANQTEYKDFPGFCAGCILPINTGKELPGESLVIDFESQHFVGTLLMRIKDAPPSLQDTAVQGDDSYFDGKKRRFQAIVKGKFKTPLKMSECVTGQVFTRPAGSLPAKWIVSSFIKFVSKLAPQLEASIDAQEPRFLTPLVATAHSVLEKKTVSLNESSNVDESSNDEHDDRLYNYNIYAGAQDIEAHIEEPPADDPTSIMMSLPDSQQATSGGSSSSVGNRQKVRKKAFNHVSATRADEPCFDLDKEYSFEFYQHLLVFGDSFAVDMGKYIALAPITDGQPLKFMAAHKNAETGQLENLWSFDIWHESLYSYAQAAEQEE